MGIVAKYKYDGSVYADLIPEFNVEFTNYTVTDEVDSENNNHIIRTIESDSLPILMRFGQAWEEGETRASNKSMALLEILDMDTSELITGDAMFRYCVNLTSIVCNWNTSNITQTTDMFSICHSLVNIDVSNWETSKFTNIYKIFQDCNALRTLDMRNWNTSNITNFSAAFYSADYITTLDISNWIISDNANITTTIGDNASLKYIKCNIPDTIQKISSQLPTRTSDNPGTIIYQGTETLSSDVITELNSRGWNVVTNPTLIAKYKYDSKIYKNLIPVFNEGYMGFVEDEEVDANGIVTRKIEHVELPSKMRFGNNDYSKSLLEVLNMNTSAITNFRFMFRYCNNLTSISCNWDTSKVTDMYCMFQDCYNLATLDVSGWNTSNVVNMYYLFATCRSLTSLDLGKWDFSKNSTIEGIVGNAYSIKTLDISNCNKIPSYTSYAFYNTSSLTDIGMIYCNKEIINEVASLLPTDHNITIWVESDDILQYDQYDHITYKTQKVEDTVHLNSPLLMGDTIEVIDGKTYHVHRWEKIVLDDTWEWKTNQYCHNTAKTTTLCTGYNNKTYWIPNLKGVSIDGKANILCDKVNTGYFDTEIENIHNDKWGLLYLTLNNDKLITSDNLGFLNWLKDNPITAIVPKATPYYELISEEPLELTLLDITDNTINNNSILPSNMTIANKELSTIAIKPSTTYTLSFDKSNEDSEVTIDICGGEQLTTVLNRIELTTPSELGSGIRFISSDGCIISNVRLLEGSLVKEAIPKETFEGLQSSFEEGYIIGESLVGEVYHKGNSLDNSRICKVPISKTLEVNTRYTFVVDVEFEKLTSPLHLVLGDEGAAKYSYHSMNNSGINIFHTIVANSNITHIYLYANQGSDNIYTIKNLIVLEGDHTHLSEAELMRYIEKGTSHYEEEDYNHVGKYKVEYKVTGKNKFDKNKELQAINSKFGSENHHVDFNNDYIRVKIGLYGSAVFLGNIGSFKKGTYTINCECYSETLDNSNINIGYFVNDNWKHREFYRINFNTWEKFTYTFTLENDTDSLYLQLQPSGSASKYSDLDFRVRNIQIEEGTVATEYEPYKEDIKTYYLSSPLLEGDTIEDINGVATHAKRREKVVLNGGEQWEMFTDIGKFYSRCIDNYAKDTSIVISDKFADRLNTGDTIKIGGGLAKLGMHKLDKTTVSDFKQWLSQNPTTVVYELASPIYEPISTESILCDSYINGHLDVNSAVPVEKVQFRLTPDILNNYLLPSTLYTLKFDSDNSGIIDVLYLGGRTVQNNILVKKGVNTISFTLPNTLYNNKLHFEGIGFNISNIQVVATDRDIEFGYFKGLQSSFEDELVTDENDENYGKYKVECKIVGKNKFNGELEYGRYNYINGIKDANDNTSYMRFPKLIPIKNGSVRATVFGIDGDVWFVVYNTNGGYIDFGKAYDLSRFDGRVGYISFYMVQPSFADNWYIQLEEGTQATSYEPYKESIHTLYLNSPLLKGDKLVVHDGKLCHYHKMGMVVLDGSKDEYWSKAGIYIPFIVIRNVGLKPNGNMGHDSTKGKMHTNILQPNIITSTTETDNRKGIYVVGSGEYNEIRIRLTDNDTVNSVKQWLQQNPTTVVYELAEPYYEPIEPQLSQYSFSTVKDGDMDIITALPIEKINLTYRTDINGVSSIEEQIASIQEGTDISSIIDEEVDE